MYRDYGFIALLMGVGFFLGLAFAGPADVDEEARAAIWDWVADADGPATEFLVDGLNIVPDRGFGRSGFEWQVVVKASDGYCLTWAAVVQKTWEGEIGARLIELLDQGLHRQLFDLRESDPALDIDEAIERLNVLAVSTSSDNCDSLNSLASDLERTTVSVLSVNEIRLHAPVYVVEVTMAHVMTQEYQLFQDEGDLALWCEQVLAVLRSCK